MPTDKTAASSILKSMFIRRSLTNHTPIALLDTTPRVYHRHIFQPQKHFKSDKYLTHEYTCP